MENQDYEPFGDEWKKEMLKTNKQTIVDIASDIGKENERLRNAVVKLTITSDKFAERIQWLEQLNERREEVMRDRKKRAGFNNDVSFDRVFEEMLEVWNRNLNVK